MPLIEITTDRLPQPERRRGAVLDVTPEKAASMVAQGFAKLVQDQSPKPAQPAPEPAPVAAEASAAPETPDVAETAPAAAFVARRRRRGGDDA